MSNKENDKCLEEVQESEAEVYYEKKKLAEAEQERVEADRWIEVRKTWLAEAENKLKALKALKEKDI